MKHLETLRQDMENKEALARHARLAILRAKDAAESAEQEHTNAQQKYMQALREAIEAKE